MTTPVYILRIRSEGHNLAPEEKRLAVLLKRLLRAYGFRCVSIGPETPNKVTHAETTNPSQTNRRTGPRGTQAREARPEATETTNQTRS